ncbi:Phosphatidylinositol 4-kinase alpha [Exaiptasia diaphana]|nr:Phosphatidylinositol 4-kinase alpha [Exaiptasia diaphana]
MNTMPLASNLSSRRSTGGSESKDPSQQSAFKDYLKRRNLILALVRREVERLSSWYNSTLKTDLGFEGEDSLVNWSNQTAFTERSWRELVRLAWQINPDIAVFLPARFKEVACLPREVSRFVRMNPTAVADLPEALQYLVTTTTVKTDIPELTHALCWAPVPPVQAMALFSQQYPPHPLTAQYAIRVLQSFPPDSILFYIPQLVQATRYDALGFVTEYILWASQHSQLLAHQDLDLLSGNRESKAFTSPILSMHWVDQFLEKTNPPCLSQTYPMHCIYGYCKRKYHSSDSGSNSPGSDLSSSAPGSKRQNLDSPPTIRDGACNANLPMPQEVLSRAFPNYSPTILDLVLKGCNGNVLHAIEIISQYDKVPRIPMTVPGCMDTNAPVANHLVPPLYKMNFANGGYRFLVPPGMFPFGSYMFPGGTPPPFGVPSSFPSHSEAVEGTAQEERSTHQNGDVVSPKKEIENDREHCEEKSVKNGSQRCESCGQTIHFGDRFCTNCTRRFSS